LLVVIALMGLLIAFVAREFHHRAELERERARAMENYERARAAVDLYFSQVAAQSAATGDQSAQTDRAFLEQTLQFYLRAESAAASPDEKARIRDRMLQIQRKLQDDLTTPAAPREPNRGDRVR
jgi:hypothetical protein